MLIIQAVINKLSASLCILYETQYLIIIEQLEPVLSNAPIILGSSEPIKVLLDN